MGFLSKVKKAFAYEFNVLDEAPTLTPEQSRGVALGAIYAAEGNLPVNALTTEFDAATTRSVLAQAWDVAGPDDVEGAFAYLLGSGHRGYYELVAANVDAIFTLKRKEAAELMAEHERMVPANALARGLDPNKALQYYRSWLTSASMGGHGELVDPLPKSIAAWDAARVAHVARLVVDSGYATPEQVWPHMTAAVAMSREAHANWADYGNAFLVGRVFWRAGLGHTVDNDLAPFKLAVENLTKTSGSPWLEIAY
jgi:Protein of unknown function (DUF1266)